eukprot:TRINITY_DN4848_c0_g2_i2.p1 TRINITY_DN4848_c0_g2~~TRINITY_DN4848_c0_g2_i2.p1  ORF type:complete len:372 (+),score=52.33 TRINITY_DN4848_c0_g2_i2:151-1116(+)
MRNGKLSLSLTSKSKHLVRWIKSGRVSNQSLIFFLFVSSGTHLALVDAIATTSVSVMAPDTSIWEEETLAIDHDSRKVFLRFDLSRIQNYGALYGDKWTAKLRIFMKGMMPHVLTPVAPRCILSHYNQPKKDKLKASEQLFGSKKVDLSEWSWAPYELTWMTRPRSGGVEISRMSCGANTFVEFSVTNIVAQVLAEPVSRRQLTLSLETEDHVVFMTTAQQKHLELFPVITFQLRDGELLEIFSEFEKSVFLARTDVTYMTYQMDKNQETASWTLPRLLITRIILWFAAACMAFAQYECTRGFFETPTIKSNKDLVGISKR